MMDNEEIKRQYEKEFGEWKPNRLTYDEFTVWDAVGVTLSVAGFVMFLYVLISLILA